MCKKTKWLSRWKLKTWKRNLECKYLLIEKEFRYTVEEFSAQLFEMNNILKKILWQNPFKAFKKGGVFASYPNFYYELIENRTIAASSNIKHFLQNIASALHRLNLLMFKDDRFHVFFLYMLQLLYILNG